LFLGGYKYGDLVLQVGVVPNLGQFNVVMSTVGLGPENDYAGEASSNYKRQTDPLVIVDDTLEL
jgi:hypothetical protein